MDTTMTNGNLSQTFFPYFTSTDYNQHWRLTLHMVKSRRGIKLLLHLKVMMRMVLPIGSLGASRWICASTVLQQDDCFKKHLMIQKSKKKTFLI